MCAITGIISLNGIPVPYEHIVAMTDVMKHRGPDGEGFLITNADEFCNSLKSKRADALVISEKHTQSVAFGHRRLSILDLASNAAQPMKDFNDRYRIVYNGEIYNHALLRKQLEGLGYKFRTDHSDTEVILNAYTHWGVDCLKKFNGMWAFCIWDTQENTVFLARDPVGKKPLYYTEFNNQFYFASELKALLTNRDIPRRLNESAVYDYFTYLTVLSPKTIFKEIKKLPAAHYLFFTPGKKIHLEQYWSPLRKEPYLDRSEKDIIEALKEKLDESVKLRFMADVEIGLLLSGGLDSSINLACLSKYADKPIKTFSVGFENKGSYRNEFEYARQVAKQFKSDYHELVLSEKDFIDFFSEMMYFQDEPIADPANIPIYYIAKTARQKGVKVLLGGEGGDELFIGYELWNISRRFENVLQGKPALAKIAGILHRNSPVSHKRKYYHGWYNKVAKNQPVFWSGTEFRSEFEKQRIMSSGFLSKMGDYDSFKPLRNLFESFQANKNLDSYDWMTSSDILNRLPDMLLARLDRMTMAASVEGRSPFLDTNLIEYVMRIPPGLKSNNKQDKYILKKAFEGILPDKIIYRKKDSFPVPLEQFFKNAEFKNNCLEAIEEFNKDTDTFSPGYMQELKNSVNSDELWNVLNLACWYKKFKS